MHDEPPSRVGAVIATPPAAISTDLRAARSAPPTLAVGTSLAFPACAGAPRLFRRIRASRPASPCFRIRAARVPLARARAFRFLVPEDLR